jgi:branched-chain amino acid transport system substrate-binding protein
MHSPGTATQTRVAEARLRSVEAIKMVIADFGGTVLGRKIVLLVSDHQNKPDIAASKAREWADQNGLNRLFGGTH